LIRRNPIAKYKEIKIGLNSPNLHKEIQIAIVNIAVKKNNIRASFRGNPILTLNRFSDLNTLLNAIRKYKSAKINLLIFPELCIPYAWELFLVNWARKNDIGVICGLEHRVKYNVAYNEMLMALPYKDKNQYTVCAPIRRLKKHYSPNEEHIIVNNNISIPNNISQHYHLIRWRGASFAVYNCYELANIEERSIFKSKVDFIIGMQYNRDVNYFSNIVESASRDLHCYVIQVNDSHYGDSRVVSPSKTEKMNPLRITGGENITFLTMKLDLEALREHQRVGYGLQRDSDDFKPTPPGFDIDNVITRINFGNNP